MDLSGVTRMQIAGNAYVAAKSKSTDENENLYDVMMGESVALKADQRAYLVPVENMAPDCESGSMNPMNSHKDRHAKIGQGSLGLEAICRIINHPQLQQVFFILETPQDTLDGYGEEIALLRSCYQRG